jgi:hypothetical protein
LRRNTAQRMSVEQVFRQHERPLGVDEALKFGRIFRAVRQQHKLSVM